MKEEFTWTYKLLIAKAFFGFTMCDAKENHFIKPCVNSHESTAMP